MSTWCRQVYERVLDPHRLEHLCDLYIQTQVEICETWVKAARIALSANFLATVVYKFNIL